MSEYIWTKENYDMFVNETNKRIDFIKSLREEFVANESAKTTKELHGKKLSNEELKKYLDNKAESIKERYGYFEDIIFLLNEHLEFTKTQFKEMNKEINEENKEIKA